MRYRIIRSVWLEISIASHSTTISVPLDRHGLPAERRKEANGLPRLPVKRTIDLRPGDEVLWHKGWHHVVRIAVREAEWLTEQQAIAETRQGYIYRHVTAIRSAGKRRS